MQKNESVKSVSTFFDRTSSKESSSYSKEFKSEPLSSKFEIGNINYDTPIAYFLKTYYGQSLNCYIYHLEISYKTEKNYIFILNDDLLITTEYEGLTNASDNLSKDPIILRIDYRSVKAN